MKAIKSLITAPWFHIVFLLSISIIVFARSIVVPMDDNAHYIAFMQALSNGSFDLSIPGFHGPSMLGWPMYALTQSVHANIYLQILSALMLIPVSYWLAISLFRNRFESILFMYAIALMPFLSFVALRGFTFPSFTLLWMLAICFYANRSMFAWLPLGFSFITKPFSVALVPIFVLWKPKGRTRGIRLGWVQFAVALIIPIAYITLQYSQIGRIIVGAHLEIDQTNVFMLDRIFLNAAHGIQMLFSIHNVYITDLSQTMPGNMVHSSPLLMILGLFSLLYPKDFWRDKKLAGALLLSFFFAFGLAALLDHMDHFYMETAVILLTLASIKILAAHRLLIPIVLATFHFQFLYLFLRYEGQFFTDWSLFLLPAAVDVMAILAWLIIILPEHSIKTFLKRWI